MAGRKVFSAGEVLQAADVNDFLMDQSVMVFAGTAARGSAIPSPTEGMVTYLSDSDEVQVYDGSVFKAVGPGKILQVVSATKTNTFTTTISNALEDVTGLSATITPSSASNKILVTVSLAGATNDNRNGYGVLVRDSTQIGIGDADSSRPRVSFDLAMPNNGAGDIFNARTVPTRSLTYLDSPSTTSAITYKIQVYASTFVSTNAIYINRTQNNEDDVRGVRPISTITLMEVAG